MRNAQYAEHQAKQALDEKVFKEVVKNKSLLGKAGYYGNNIQGVSRSLMTGFDLSAVLRQGGLLARGSPLRSARIMGDMLRAARSDKDYFKLMQDIRERPNASLYVTSKLALTDVKSPNLSHLEEAYMSQWADKIPLLNHSQRAYVYFLNRLRADTFDTMASNAGCNGHVTAEQAKGLSNFINVFTGRGYVPDRASGAIAAMNNLFFAPRYVLSRFQALTLQPLRYAKDPTVRKLIAQEYAKTLIGYAVMYGLIGTGLKQLGAKVEFNPLSSDFGKIVIGKTHYDPMAGIAQTLTFMARVLTGRTKTQSGKIESLTSKTVTGAKAPFSQRNLGNVIFDFGRSKLAPIPSAMLNAQWGQKVTGEQTTGLKELAGLVIPMSGSDLLDAMKEQGVAKGTALGILSILGDSVNTYPPKFQGHTRKAHRSRH